MSDRLFMTTDTVGGVWRYASTLATQLAAHGMTVRLGVVGPSASPEQRAQIDAVPGVDLVELDAPLDWLAGDAQTLARGRRAIAAAASVWGASSIQLNQPAYAAPDSPAPTVVVAHSCVESWWQSIHSAPTPPDWCWHKRAVRDGLTAAAATIAPSDAFARTLQTVYRLPRQPVVVRNGLPAATSMAAKANYVLAAGRAWDAGKNFAVLDRAAADIDWPVRLAGPAREPGGHDDVRFANLHCLGLLDTQRMARELAAAPIFVAPSRYEPFGLGVLEAAQAGAALVLSDIPTFRELWSGAALFFDPHDPAALARQVNRVIGDPVLRLRMAAAARLQAGEYTIERTAAHMRAVYRMAAPSQPQSRVAV